MAAEHVIEIDTKNAQDRIVVRWLNTLFVFEPDGTLFMQQDAGGATFFRGDELDLWKKFLGPPPDTEAAEKP